MNHNDLQLTVAKAIGYTNLGKPHPQEDPRFEPQLMGDFPGKVERQYVPDYPKDLNAMYEAEKMLTRSQRVKFVEELCGVVGLSWRPTSHFDTIHATAAQRAEAFCRVINQVK